MASKDFYTDINNTYCEYAGKHSYDKKGAISAANKRFREEHKQLRIYPCGNHWHLTSQIRDKIRIKKVKRKQRYVDYDAE